MPATEDGSRVAAAPVAAGVGGGDLESAPAAATLTDRKRRLPGIYDSGRYLILEPASPLDYLVLPLSLFDSLFVQFTSLSGMAAGVSPVFSSQLTLGLLVPTRRGQPLGLVGRDLSTGFEVFRTDAPPPPPGEIPDFAPDPGDHEPPVPVDGTPFRFVPIRFDQNGLETLAPGTTALMTGGTLRITFAAGTLAEGTHATLVALAGGSPGATVRAGASGEVTLTLAAQLGKPYLLAVGAPLPPTGTIRISFSEALRESFAGLLVRAPNGRDAQARITPLGSREVLEIAPAAGWQAGGRYILELGPGLSDAQGNAWGVNLSLPFEIEKSQVLGNVALTEVRDTARLGDWLFVAAGPQGLGVIDVSNPLALPAVGGVGAQVYPFPLADPVQGLAVDPHGRVLVTGGGIGGFGQLKIFDPLTESYAGSTLVSDPLGNNLSSLPEGSPRRVAVLSEDTRQDLVAGAAPPLGIAVETAPLAPPPSTAVRLTLRGTATPKLPVSLFNRTRGRWERVDADAAGAFAVSIDAEPGDALELLRNERSLAYVVVRGVGIGVVDVNAFYREEHGDVPATQSDLLGFYTGQEDPNLQLCNQPVFEIGSAILDLSPLVSSDPAAPHRLTVAGLVGFRGVALFESDPIDLGDVRFYNESCLRIEGNAAVSALEVLTDYAFRSADTAQPAEPRDYLLVTHRTAGLLILDAEDRDNLILAARVPLPIEAAELTVDRNQRKAYVSGTGGGLAIVDLDKPLTGLPRDLDGDGRDDRVLEVIDLPGNVNAPALVIPELGLAFAGGVDGSGLTAISIAEPRLEAVRIGEAGELGRVEELAPHGVPSSATRDLAGSFRVLASLPGLTTDEIRLDVVSLGPGGEEIDGAGDPTTTPGLPPTSRTGTEALTLRRLSSDPREDGHHLYLSEEIAVVADLRAAPDYQRTTDENAVCPRCETTAGVKSILAGDTIAVRLPSSLSTQLLPLFGPQRLARLGLQLPSTPWETTCSPDQEPAQNASLSAAGPPGVFLHSGELTLSAVDLSLPGIGLDLVVARHYRSGTIGQGPLGPGWELGFRQRLREMPNGEIEYRDGSGRCEVFRKRTEGRPDYGSPNGVFANLARLSNGWQLQLTHGETLRFDRWGRLVAIGDRSRRSGERGSEIQFSYDSYSRLSQIRDDRGRIHRLECDALGRLTAFVDFQSRTTSYAYDAAGRLVSVTSPPITTGAQPFPAGLVTRYRYEEVAGGTLATALHQAGDLVAWVDPEGQDRTTWTFTDASGDGRTEEVTAASWAGGTATVAYDFTARTATITDRAGLTEAWQHDDAGHPTQRTDIAGGAWNWSYDSHGRMTEHTSATGIRQSFTYPTGETEEDLYARNLANLEIATTTPASGDPSLAEQVDSYEYDPEFNEVTSWKHNGEARIAAEISADHGRPLEVTEAPDAGPLVTGLRKLVLDERGRIRRQTDEMGRVSLMTYSVEGDLAAVEQLGVVPPPTTRFEYDARKNVTAIIDPRGTRTERIYDERDRLIEESVPGTGVKTEYVYDALDRVIEIRRAAGDDGSQTARTRVTYLPGRNQPSTLERELTSGVFATETRTYDAAERLVEIVGPEGETTTIEYLDAERRVRATHSGPGLLQTVVEVTEYDADGREIAFVDGRGQRWETRYDGLGRPVESRNPRGDKALLSYDALNRPIQQRAVDANGCLLTAADTAFDARDRAVSQTAWLFPTPPTLCLGDPTVGEALRTRYQYDLTGQLISITDPLDRLAEFRDYDPLGRLLSVVDFLGNRAALTLDPGGLPTIETLTEGGSTRLVTHRYDALGRRIESRDGLGQKTTVTFDALSNPRLVVDPEGTFTETVYDLGSRPIAMLRPEGIRVEQLFDDSDRLTGYRDALGNFTSYSYDALGRRVATVFPDSTTELSSFDATGNPIVVTDPRGTVQQLTYDPAGRLTARAITLGSGVVGPIAEAFEYDGLSRLTRAQSGTGVDAVVSERRYDSLSRLLGETQNGRAVTFGYDEIGARTALTYPSGPSYQLAVDALGRPSSLTQFFSSSSPEPRAAFTYQGFSRQATTLGTSFTATSSFDAAARLTEKSWVGGPGALTETLAWTPKSLIASITRSPVDLGDSAFSYDQASRLIGAQRTKPPVAPATTPTVLRTDNFTYDTAENLLAHTEQTACEPSASTTAFPLDPSGRNRPSAAGAETLEWDPSGNLVRKGSQRFQYDYKNRLTVVTDLGGSVVATYSYDAFNRRVKKQVGTIVTETVWDDWEPIEEYRNGQLASRRLFGPELGELLRLENDLDGDGLLEQIYLPVFDVFGNLAELRRENGDLVERYDYSPFGERRVIADGADPCDWTASSAAANAFGFHGLLEDDETGLLYARNRFFDPEMGRFVSMDPLGYVDGPNAYAYGMNSPANYSDPMGLEAANALEELLFTDFDIARESEQLARHLNARRQFGNATGRVPRAGEVMFSSQEQNIYADGQWIDISGRIFAADHEMLFVGMGSSAVGGFLASRAAGGGVLRAAGAASLGIADELVAEATVVGPQSLLKWRGPGRRPAWQGENDPRAVGSLAGLSRDEVLFELEGYTLQGSRVARAVREGRVRFNVLGDGLFERTYARHSGSAVNAEQALGYHVKDQIYLRSTGKLSEVVHEGTHSLDYLSGLYPDNPVPGVKALSKKSRENRARFYERQFQIATGAQVEFPNIRRMLAYVHFRY
jgi:RHS repeat-associated protein